MRGIDEYPLLDANSSDDWASVVHSLNAHWVHRHRPLPYHTLGTPTYLDALDGFHRYQEKLIAGNTVLRQYFSHLYEQVSALLEEVWEAAVVLDERLALPGFHILGSSSWFALPFATPHRDKQFELLDWDGFGEVDVSHPKSFTLPLRVPSSGAGLDVWDLDDQQIESDADDDWLLQPTHYQRYTVGNMVLVDGLPMHRMAPYTNVRENDERITLQGHAVRCEDRWLLYW